jgi:hypothetical protein
MAARAGQKHRRERRTGRHQADARTDREPPPVARTDHVE